MKKNSILIIMLILFLPAGCGTLNFRGRDSVRYIETIPAMCVIEFRQDHTFIVKDYPGVVSYTGEWSYERGRLILTSDCYRIPYQDLDTLMKEAVNLYCFSPELTPFPEDDYEMELYNQALEWYFSPSANAGDRDIYLIKGRRLYDGINKRTIEYIRLQR
ncbi:MAG: hypothetical protein IAC07_01020 [Bacteroidetes bacterium]|uniref:Uncharacterized protein n=1 Tax=Candidatus Cryptobacteroides gallistercoris TaxID=2840765 RepID=A0A940DPK0_9BACT|nr:hypothetical protein [Candidatus Cryptobacteroides gallistercoris]